MFKSEKRLTYETLKSWGLTAYFDGCRDFAVTGNWSHEQVLAYVSYSFEDGFEHPIEDFMWQVILLIISGGWHIEWAALARRNISDQLEQCDLSKFLEDVPKDEADIFRHDLHILKLI